MAQSCDRARRECQLSDGKVVHWSQRLMAKTCPTTPCTRNSGVVANCAGFMASRLVKNRSDRVYTFAGTPGPSRQPVDLNGCVRLKTWRMRRHHELCPLSCIDRSQRSKSQNERKEEVTTISQRAAQIVEGAHTKEKEDVGMSKMRPRTLCLQHRFYVVVDGL